MVGARIGVIALLSVIGLGGYYFHGERHKKAFNSEYWQAWVESEADCCARWDMVPSLERRYKLIGMHRSALIQLLGVPNGESAVAMHYYLGMTRHGIDTASLSFTLNKAGYVVSYQLGKG